MTKKIGVLTGGGDCGGLNAAIGAIVKSACNEGWEVYQIKKGWEGLISNQISHLLISDVEGIHSQTGTILQTSRTNPFTYTGKLDGQDFKKADISEFVIENAKNIGLEAVICCGGDDTLSVIPKLIEKYGDDITFIGIPKTMDGDLQVYSLGLDTAINRAKKELEDFVPILKASGSIGIVEFFGRDVGRVTFKAGIAANADVILIPEIKIDLNYTSDFIADRYDERAKRNSGTSYVLVAVAEGTKEPLTDKHVYLNNGKDSFGHGKLGGVGDRIAKLVQDQLENDSRIKKHTRKLDIKTERPTYAVRGGETLYSDSYVGQKLGATAVQYLKMNGKSGMAIVDFTENSEIKIIPIQQVIQSRSVHLEVLKLFEKTGLYCFGRKPDGKIYQPTIVVSK